MYIYTHIHTPDLPPQRTDTSTCSSPHHHSLTLRIHTYMCTYIYIYTCVYIHKYNIHIYVYIHTHIWLYAYTHIFVHIYTHIHACIYSNLIHIYIYIYIYLTLWIHTFCTYIYTYTCAYILKFNTYIYIYTHKHTRTPDLPQQRTDYLTCSHPHPRSPPQQSSALLISVFIFQNDVLVKIYISLFSKRIPHYWINHTLLMSQYKFLFIIIRSRSWRRSDCKYFDLEIYWVSRWIFLVTGTPFTIIRSHPWRRSDCKYLDLEIYRVSWQIFLVTGTPFTQLKKCLEFWKLRWKRVCYVWRRLWKLVTFLAVVIIFKTDLLYVLTH